MAGVELATLCLTQASVQALLSRYSRTTDIVVGTPLANRSHPELAGVVGYFVNTVALRSDLSGAPIATSRELGISALLLHGRCFMVVAHTWC